MSRELFKYWRVNAGKWVSFNAHNSSALETQGGGNQLSIKNKKKKHTYSEMLFILSICEREREGELEIIIYSEQRYDIACW